MDDVTAPERRIEYLPLSSITPDSKNPKSHDLATIDKSIGRFGVIDAIVIDGRTGRIISGHGRREALVQMRDRGETPPEGVRVSDDGDWLVPVAAGWSSRTDSEASAALVALNRTTELGGWVDDALLDILDELVEQGDDGLAGVGFDEMELGRLRQDLSLLESVTDDAWSETFDKVPREGDEQAIYTRSFQIPGGDIAVVDEALKLFGTKPSKAIVAMARHCVESGEV